MMRSWIGASVLVLWVAFDAAQAQDRRMVSSVIDLASALSTAHAGETILLQSGDYGDLKLNHLNFSDIVTIKSADGDMGARFSSLQLSKSSGIRIESVHVDSSMRGGRAVVHIDSSRGIEIVDSEINGLVGNGYPITGPQFGIYVSGSSRDIVIENNDIHDVLNGMALFGTKDINVSGNTVDRVGSDAFKFSQVDGGIIANNTGPSTFYPTEDAHADFMQFQGPGSSNLVISGNVFLPQNRFDAQGIFLAGNGGHSNITIEQNIIYTQMANGISISGTDNITIRNNTVINALNDDRPRSGITLSDRNAPGVTVENNITSFRYGEYDGKNLLIQHTNKGGAFHYDDVFVNASASKGVTLTDLAPVPGSQAERMGALQRWRELVE